MDAAPRAIRLPVPMQITRAGDGLDLGEIVTHFGWTANDPYAISMFFPGDDEDVQWFAAVDLFLAAMADEKSTWHGEGDISVQFDENIVYVSMQGEDKPPVITKMSAVGVAPFFDRVRRLREVHGGYISALISEELDGLLEVEA